MQTDALGACPWLCGWTPNPPAPFAWPFFAVLDVIRILMAVVGVALLLVSIWAIRRSTTNGQKMRFAFAGMLCLGLASRHILRVGLPPNWVFFVDLAALLLGVRGYYHHLFHEIPAQERTTRQDPSP